MFKIRLHEGNKVQNIQQPLLLRISHRMMDMISESRNEILNLRENMMLNKIDPYLGLLFD